MSKFSNEKATSIANVEREQGAPLTRRQRNSVNAAWELGSAGGRLAANIRQYHEDAVLKVLVGH